MWQLTAFLIFRASFINKINRISIVNDVKRHFSVFYSNIFRFGRVFRWVRICILHILLLRAWYQLHNISSYRGFFSLCAQYFVHFHLHRLRNKHKLAYLRRISFSIYERGTFILNYNIIIINEVLKYWLILENKLFICVTRPITLERSKFALIRSSDNITKYHYRDTQHKINKRDITFLLSCPNFFMTVNFFNGNNIYNLPRYLPIL